MSTSRIERTAGYLAEPFDTAEISGRATHQTTGIGIEDTRNAGPPSPVSRSHGPPAGPHQSSAMPVADKVHSQVFGTVKVCFYQYNSRRIIRAIARKNGIAKERIFTPEIARARCVVFDMLSAIEWVKVVGFRDVEPMDSFSLPSPEALYAQPTPREAPPPAAPAPRPRPQQRAAPPPPERPPVQAPRAPAEAPPEPSPQHSPSPTASRSEPVEGTISFLGKTTRPAWQGRPGYTTYAIKIRKASGYEKEFLGEHLAELARQLRLRNGMPIRIQLLGKKHFTVEIRDGEFETRYMNEYSINVL